MMLEVDQMTWRKRMSNFKITYYDEIEATNLEQAIEFLLQHLQHDVDNKDVEAWTIEEIKE